MSFNAQNKKTVIISPIVNNVGGNAKESNKNQTLPLCVTTAIDCLLKKDTDMFESACTIRDVMTLEGFDQETTAKMLGITKQDVKDKLLLLDFSSREKKYIQQLEYSQGTAVAFAKLDKRMRKIAFCVCRENGYDSKQALKFVKALTAKLQNETNGSTNDNNVLSEKNIKGKAHAMFLYNSLDRAVNLAKKAGINVQKNKKDLPDGAEVVIRVKE